jgi:hypothetical protein
MTDPSFARLDEGFEIFAVGVFVWASVDCNRFIRFWMLKPAPYSLWVRTVFRIFFIACVVGGIWQIAEDVARSGRSVTFYLTALPFTAAWFIVFYVMMRLVEGMKRNRDINTHNDGTTAKVGEARNGPRRDDVI